MSSIYDLRLSQTGARIRKLPGGLVLHVREAKVLFDETLLPCALYDGEVFFPDQGVTKRAQAVINDFHPEVPRTRLPMADFQFMLASLMMRNLRPMLRRTTEETSQ